MNNILEYKGYFTRVEFSADDNILYGKIEGIRDLVTFECENVKDLEKEFHEAVDDYLAFCSDIGQEPDKTYSGSFNVRVTPVLHRAAAMAAAREGINLNAYVKSAIQDKVEGLTRAEFHFHIEQPKLAGYEFDAGMKNGARLRGIPYGTKC